MARSGRVSGSQTLEAAGFRAYRRPGAGLVTGFPVGSVGTHAGSAAVAKGLVRDGWPLLPIVLIPGTNPMSSGFEGPRLVVGAGRRGVMSRMWRGEVWRR